MSASGGSTVLTLRVPPELDRRIAAEARRRRRTKSEILREVLRGAFQQGRAPEDPIQEARRQSLLVSGRASFEIMQKALAARIPIVAAISAPSSLAVDFARANGQTLIGFLRGAQMNIYSHPERISWRQKASRKPRRARGKGVSR